MKSKESRLSGACPSLTGNKELIAHTRERKRAARCMSAVPTAVSRIQRDSHVEGCSGGKTGIITLLLPSDTSLFSHLPGYFHIIWLTGSDRLETELYCGEVLSGIRAALLFLYATELHLCPPSLDHSVPNGSDKGTASCSCSLSHFYQLLPGQVCYIPPRSAQSFFYFKRLTGLIFPLVCLYFCTQKPPSPQVHFAGCVL